MRDGALLHACAQGPHSQGSRPPQAQAPLPAGAHARTHALGGLAGLSICTLAAATAAACPLETPQNPNSGYDDKMCEDVP